MTSRDFVLFDSDDAAGPGQIWMQVAPGQIFDNGSRDLWPGDRMLLRTQEAAALEAAGVVTPCVVGCGYLLPQIVGPA